MDVKCCIWHTIFGKFGRSMFYHECKGKLNIQQEKRFSARRKIFVFTLYWCVYIFAVYCQVMDKTALTYVCSSKYSKYKENRDTVWVREKLCFVQRCIKHICLFILIVYYIHYGIKWNIYTLLVAYGFVYIIYLHLYIIIYNRLYTFPCMLYTYPNEYRLQE